MRKIFHPSSPHALSTGASQGVSHVSLDSQNLGSAGQNYGFFAYLMDLQSKELHPSAPPAPPPEAPATQINDNGIPQPGTYVNGVKIGESFEVALFLVGMLGLFGIALLACFILSWAAPPKNTDFSPQSQQQPATNVPLTHYYPNAQYVAMETQLLQPPSIREQQVAIVQQAMEQHAIMQQQAAMQHAGMQPQAAMQPYAIVPSHPPMQSQPMMQQQQQMHAHRAMQPPTMHYNGMQTQGSWNQTQPQTQPQVSIDPATGRAR